MNGDEASSFTWHGVVPVGTVITELGIAFNVTRTKLHAVDLYFEEIPPGGSEATERKESLAVGPLTAHGDFDPPLVARESDRPIRAEALFSGEVPRPRAIKINGQGEKAIALPDWRPESIADDPTPAMLQRLWALERQRLSVRVIAENGFDNGEAQAEPSGVSGPPAGQIAEAPAPEAPAVGVLSPQGAVALMAPAPPAAAAAASTAVDEAAFAERFRAIQWEAELKRTFYELDLETHPATAREGWAADRDVLRLELHDRIHSRVGFAQTGVWQRIGPPGPAAAIERLKTVSGIFRRRFFALEATSRGDLLTTGGAPRPIDLFDWAFELFVCGHLVTHHNDIPWQTTLLSHGAPDGHMFLRFTELAIYCLESAIDEPFWRPKLRTLVRCTHIFLESAAPLLSPPYPKDELLFLYDAERAYPRARRTELRSEYEALVGGLAWQAEFDILRARFSALLGLALVHGGPRVITAGNQAVPANARATLRPQGIAPGYQYDFMTNTVVPEA